MAIGCFVSTGRSFDQAIARVQLAESLGYEAAYVTQLSGRESLTVLTAYAMRTERIFLGTGVVPIYSRTPATMAQAAATIYELSLARMRLGLGVSHRAIVEGWHGSAIGSPVGDMREYVAIVRAILDGLAVPSGDRFASDFRLTQIGPYPDLPIYVAALSPGMLRLAGRIADGVMLWLCNPAYIREVVVPEVNRGREAAGKTLDGFDIVAAVPAGVTDDRAATYRTLRRELLPYFGLPFYREMLERSGFGPEIERFDHAAGDQAETEAAISDRLLEALGAIGDPDAVRAGVQRYLDAGTTSPCVAPIRAADFDGTLRAAAPAGASARAG